MRNSHLHKEMWPSRLFFAEGHCVFALPARDASRDEALGNDTRRGI